MWFLNWKFLWKTAFLFFIFRDWNFIMVCLDVDPLSFVLRTWWPSNQNYILLLQERPCNYGVDFYVPVYLLVISFRIPKITVHFWTIATLCSLCRRLSLHLQCSYWVPCFWWCWFPGEKLALFLDSCSSLPSRVLCVWSFFFMLITVSILVVYFVRRFSWMLMN